MAKFKAEVHINEALGSDITLELTQEQTSVLLDRFMSGATAHVNLATPTSNGRDSYGRVKEDSAAYAE